MLKYFDAENFKPSLELTSDDRANKPDHELLAHARGVIAIINHATAQLDEIRDVLMQRRGYIDGVIWQLNELGETLPTLVVSE
jgi:ABC-type transporter Mla subunit MlaD